MTEDELKQFQALAKKFEPKDKETVLKIVQDDIHPVFQDINDGGRAAANDANKKKLDAAETAKTTAEEARKKAEADLAELEGKAPEAAKLKQKYEDEVTKARQEAEAKLSENNKELLEERLEVAKNRLKSSLAKLKIDEEYIETILINRGDIVARLKPCPKGKVDVLKAGSTDLTIVPPEGKSPVDVFAEELAPTVPTKWQKSGVQKGSGTSGSSGGSSGTGDRFTAIREEVKAETKNKQERTAKRSGLERITGSRR